MSSVETALSNLLCSDKLLLLHKKHTDRLPMCVDKLFYPMRAMFGFKDLGLSTLSTKHRSTSVRR